MLGSSMSRVREALAESDFFRSKGMISYTSKQVLNVEIRTYGDGTKEYIIKGIAISKNL